MFRTKIPSLLSEHFNFHKSRIDCLTIFIFGIIQVRSINLCRICQAMNYENPDSAYKRLIRFIQEVLLLPGKLAFLISAIIGLEKRGKWRLVFDRTNWKFGKQHINILFLAVCRERLAIPLFFTFLKDKKSGNSNHEDRIELLKKFIQTFGKKCIGVLLGDREFIGFIWLKYLIQEGIPFCFRIKDGWQKISTKDGQMLEVRKCFRGLKKGQSRSLGLRKLGDGKKSVYCYITGLRNQNGDWVILAHSENIEDPCEDYRDRWQIETMFRAMKTGGFNLEDTHVTESDRLECLIGVICIAYAICYKSGEMVIAEDPPKVKKHGYYPKSIFRYGLDKLEQLILQSTQATKFKRFMRQIFSPIRLTKKSFVQ